MNKPTSQTASSVQSPVQLQAASPDALQTDVQAGRPPDSAVHVPPDLRTHDADAPLPAPVTLRAAVWFWFTMGLISFGGPAGQIALLHEEVVVRRRWLSESRFLHALQYCMVLPGPEAQQLATYIGWLMHRTVGGVIAGVLFVLPSLLILIALSWAYLVWGHTPWMTGLFYGIKPAVTALVFQAAWRIGQRTLTHRMLLAIAAAAWFGMSVLDWPFPLIVLLAALAGWIGGYWRPTAFQRRGGTHGPASSHASGPAWIDDNTPTPPHAQFAWSRCWRVLGVGALLWCIPLGLLVVALGWEHLYAEMARFFTQAALLTFGGAYAVLPYVYEGAVVDAAWLTPAQMMDGLALGETTPGPLIMVVAYVGFIAAYLQAPFGSDALFLAGAVGAVVVTWFTFLPSFVFILVGGPFVETTHQQLRFTAPLIAITAAVVGVILHLAVFFAIHVLFPAGLGGAVDWRAAALGAAALLALVRFQARVPVVIAACAASGVLLQALG